MDSIFLLEDETRAHFLRAMGGDIGCTYICLWFYLPLPQNCLISMGAWYNDDEMDQPSSSTGSLSRRVLFDEYSQSLFNVEHGCVPGHAFNEGMPFLELHDLELMRWVWNETQRRFYLEAGIKTVIFMGCRSGEVEIGMTNSTNINAQLEIRNLLTEGFFQQYQLRKPLIMDHVEHENVITRTSSGGWEAEITDTAFAALSSPPSASSSYQRQEISNTSQCQIGDGNGAFVSYASAIVPRMETRPTSHGQLKMKLVLAMLRSHYSTMREARLEENHPTINRSPRIFCERMRRKRFKESFQALRYLLPFNSKKDQLSVLFNTMEYLNALKAKVLELQERNRLLTMQLSPAKEARREVYKLNERVEIHAIPGDESTCEYQQIELRVTMNENDCHIMDSVLHLLECLKKMDEKMSLVSMQAVTQVHHMNKFNRAIFRLKIKTSEWDRRTIKEVLTKATEQQDDD